jgi:drug/metabolite transporter (DMT)-like permease
MGALSLVSIRLGGAALIFAVYLYMTQHYLPSKRSERLAILFVGVFNTAVPFFLISWGETRIDSGLATILNSTVPLFGLVIAHFVLADEHLSTSKLIGMLVGFVGVLIVTSRSLGDDPGSLPGQLAVLLASGCYAISIITIRRFLRHVNPFTIAGWTIIVGAVVIVTATALLERPLPTPSDIPLIAWAAGITLAIINTVVAYFLFYDLIAHWGARATLVTYAMPPIGVTLGFVFLDEAVGWQLLVGGALIIAGIVVTKLQPQPVAPEAPTPPVAASAAD